jgi:hypothetical protein
VGVDRCCVFEGPVLGMNFWGRRLGRMGNLKGAQHGATHTANKVIYWYRPWNCLGAHAEADQRHSVERACCKHENVPRRARPSPIVNKASFFTVRPARHPSFAPQRLCCLTQCEYQACNKRSCVFVPPPRLTTCPSECHRRPPTAGIAALGPLTLVAHTRPEGGASFLAARDSSAAGLRGRVPASPHRLTTPPPFTAATAAGSMGSPGSTLAAHGEPQQLAAHCWWALPPGPVPLWGACASSEFPGRVRPFVAYRMRALPPRPPGSSCTQQVQV